MLTLLVHRVAPALPELLVLAGYAAIALCALGRLIRIARTPAEDEEEGRVGEPRA